MALLPFTVLLSLAVLIPFAVLVAFTIIANARRQMAKRQLCSIDVRGAGGVPLKWILAVLKNQYKKPDSISTRSKFIQKNRLFAQDE